MNTTIQKPRIQETRQDIPFLRLENELLQKTLKLMGIPGGWLDGGDPGVRNLLLRRRLVAEWLQRQGREGERERLFGC